MNHIILHIDFNSYFATVEQQANPRLRGKPIGVTGGPARNAFACEAGGDRLERTVLGAASIEAKRFGVKTGMNLWEAKKLCPDIILVPGDSDKYLSCTTKFINILKNYSPYLEVFSIDECFLEILRLPFDKLRVAQDDNFMHAISIALMIKNRIKQEIGEVVTCSVGISYNKLMAKLAGSLYKPDGLVVIADEEAARWILDRVELDEICGIGPRIKKRLFNLGVKDFKTLRLVPQECLLASFKSYGETLYNMARGIDYNPILPFYEREEVKSIGHRHTIDHDTSDPEEIKQILLKLSEMIAARLRSKKLLGKTVHCWFRYGISNPRGLIQGGSQSNLGGLDAFFGNGMQTTIKYTDDGLEIFQAAWRIFQNMWYKEKIRMVGASVSNLKPAKPVNLSLLPEENNKEKIYQALDCINNKFGNFTLQRATLLSSCPMQRKPNPFLSDRRFKL